MSPGVATPCPAAPPIPIAKVCFIAPSLAPEPAYPQSPSARAGGRRAQIKVFDILLSLRGEDSYGAGCWSGLFGGFLPQRPYFRRGQRRGLTFGLSAHRSFGREDDRKNRRKKKEIGRASCRERV